MQHFKILYFGVYHTACIPDTFEVVAGQRQVIFSWCPPLEVQHSRLITSYTLSCSPSPSSLPQSISQSGLLTVAGFSPDTSYSCSVVASNSQGSEVAAVKTFSTSEDCESGKIKWVTLCVSNTFYLCRYIFPTSSWWSGGLL